LSRENLSRTLGLLLVVSTLTAYWHLLFCDFISFDDPFYVTGNPQVLAGLDRANIVWAFTSFHSSNWHPLTWLSHMLDCELFGLHPVGHHLTNLLIHLGNTLLLFLFLRETTHQTWRSFIVAALFSLHPLHVESVAWVSERKDVLSTFFWMLALIAYVAHVRQPRLYRYLLVLFLFALGLMAKPMVVTFPFVLLLLDYWPLRRADSPPYGLAFEGELPTRENPGVVWGRLLLEKVPFLLLSVASSVVTILAQAEGRAFRSLDIIPFGMRVSNALVSYAHYMYMMLWPQGLSVFYPHPVGSVDPWLVFVSAILLAGLSATAIRLALGRPYLLVGWLWYLGTLVPVIGLLQVGDQAMADRYTYIPLIGLFVAMVWGFSDLFAACGVRRIFVVALVGTICLALIDGTQSQLRYWQNNETLFQRALRVTRDNYVAHLMLAQVAKADGKPYKALFHKNKAVEINPLFVAKTHNRWGYFLAQQGQMDEAIEDFEEAIRICPDYANAHKNLGVVLARKGRLDEAIAHFTEVLRLSPGDPDAREGLKKVESQRDLYRSSPSKNP
jgi:hypothetical protein